MNSLSNTIDSVFYADITKTNGLDTRLQEVEYLFNKAIIELYTLKEKYEDNPDITESVDLILKNLLVGMAAVTDIIAGTIKNNNNTIKH